MMTRTNNNILDQIPFWRMEDSQTQPSNVILPLGLSALHYDHDDAQRRMHGACFQFQFVASCDCALFPRNSLVSIRLQT